MFDKSVHYGRMLTKRLYKNGNSVVVTIPKEYLKQLNLREGSEVSIEQDLQEQAIVISSKKKNEPKSSVTPKFLRWLDSFNKEYGPALKELAKR